MNNEHKDKLLECAKAHGAADAAVIDAAAVPLRREFLAACESNACGKYGRCWTCPPDIGAIDDLMESLKAYSRAFVYQSVWPLEDSYDIEGMQDGALGHNKLCQALTDEISKIVPGLVLRLGAGGCQLCERCAKLFDKPCVHPKEAIVSLEAYGIAVSELAEICGMKYINGQNTVTYFGVFFY